LTQVYSSMFVFFLWATNSCLCLRFCFCVSSFLLLQPWTYMSRCECKKDLSHSFNY